MTINDCLKVLGCDNTATLDEIKKKYRKLSKKYHPDLNKSVDPMLFIRLNTSYEYLVAHHKPQPKSKRPPMTAKNAPPFSPLDDTMKEVERFYRVYDGKYPMIITLPLSVLEKETIIFCMIDYTEYHIRLPKGTELPITVDIHNVRGYKSFLVGIKGKGIVNE
jgi:hypothetical protein